MTRSLFPACTITAVACIFAGPLGKVGGWEVFMLARVLVAVFVIVAIFGAYKLVSADSNLPSVGSAAPDFTLNSQEGTPVSLKDFRGKWVVLYFYPKDMTTGCTIEAHNFQRDQPQYSERNAVVLGVSVDSVDSHKQFCAKDGLSFKLLADTEKTVAAEYGSLMNMGIVKIAARNTFIIDPEGKIERVYSKVDPNKHSQEVLAALDELHKSASAMR
jgi:peroxiredoxin Q/BCP